jgi:hypothetical protein
MYRLQKVEERNNDKKQWAYVKGIFTNLKYKIINGKNTEYLCRLELK